MSSTKPAAGAGKEGGAAEAANEIAKQAASQPNGNTGALPAPDVAKQADEPVRESKAVSEEKSDLATDNPTSDEAAAPNAAENDAPPPYTAKAAYIAVMGQTGVGKSSFINDATNGGLKVGHELISCTKSIQLAETVIDGRRVVFIDTPGFDDTYLADAAILKLIGDYLQAANAQIQLTGVIYLHRITDNRMAGCAVISLRLLKRLCGPENYGNVVLATGHWDVLRNESDGVRREEELRNKNEFWADLIKEGATLCRHKPDKESALAVARHLLEKTPTVLAFQRELAEHGIIAQTSVGQEAIKNMAKAQRENEELVEQLKTALEEAKSVAENLKKEAKKKDTETQKLQDEISKLKGEISNMGKAIKSLNDALDVKEQDDKCIVQ